MGGLWEEEMVWVLDVGDVVECVVKCCVCLCVCVHVLVHAVFFAVCHLFSELLWTARRGGVKDPSGQPPG